LLTDSSKVFLPFAGVGLGLGLFYAAASSDNIGATLLLFLLVAAGVVGLTLLRYRENEVAPPVAEDAPVAEPRPVRPEPAPAGGGWALLGGCAIGLAVSGLVIGPAAAISGIALGAIVLFGWLASLSGERTGRALNLLPIGLPLMGFFAIGTLIFFMSRILLAVPSANASTTIAVVVAVLVLGGGTLVAARPNISSSALVTALAVAGVLFLAGGLAAARLGERKAEAGAFAGPVSITAKNLKFDKPVLELRPESPTILHFKNEDSVPHNIAIYSDESLSRTIFSFDPIPGPISQDLQFTSPAAGRFFFRCDVHPQQMKGTVVVRAAAAHR
jgi:plastocyanin